MLRALEEAWWTTRSKGIIMWWSSKSNWNAQTRERTRMWWTYEINLGSPNEKGTGVLGS